MLGLLQHALCTKVQQRFLGIHDTRTEEHVRSRCMDFQSVSNCETRRCLQDHETELEDLKTEVETLSAALEQQSQTAAEVDTLKQVRAVSSSTCGQPLWNI